MSSKGCIFNWQKEIAKSHVEYFSRISEKCKNITNDSDGKRTRIVFNIILSIENYKMDKLNESLIKLEDCETLLNLSQDDFRTSFIQGTQYVINSSRKFLLEKIYGKSWEGMSASVTSKFELLDSKSQGVVYGLKSAVLLEYMFINWDTALHYAKMAISMDREEAEWYYLAGKCLSRSRNHTDKLGRPSDEEIGYLEKAYELSDSGVYLIDLILTYLQVSHFYCRSKNTHEVNVYNEKAKAHLEVLLTKGIYSATNYARCAKIYMTKGIRDLAKAKICIEKALELDPKNGMVNHIAGRLFEFLANQTIKIPFPERYKLCQTALIHYHRAMTAGVFDAELNYIELMWEMYTTYDPTDDLRKMIPKHPDKELYLRCHITFHFYMSNKNLEEIMEELKEAMSFDVDLSFVKSFGLVYQTCHFKNQNLLQMVYDEIKSIFLKPNFDGYSQQSLNDMVKFLEERYPEVEKDAQPISWRSRLEEQIKFFRPIPKVWKQPAWKQPPRRSQSVPPTRESELRNKGTKPFAKPSAAPSGELSWRRRN